MSKKKATVKQAETWPPKRQEVETTEPVKPEKVIPRYVPKRDEQELIGALASLSGLNQELAEQIAKDGNRPNTAKDLAEKYHLVEWDAEAILTVLNA